MKSLQEIEAAEAKTRDRAWRYGKLADQCTRLTKTIEQLEASFIDLRALEKIVALVPEVPAGLHTRASRFMPGGFLVQELLQNVAGDALEEAQRKQKDIATAITKSKKDLAEVDAARKAVERE